MSLAVLIISLLFAGVQVGVSWLMLAFEPVAQLLKGVPIIVTTGIIFGIGMLLTFVLIILVGGMGLTKTAASYVRDHFGRTLALALVITLLILAISVGGEMIYQAEPLALRQTGGTASDICFVLDYSSSMTEPTQGGASGEKRIDSLRQAFESAVATLNDTQRVCVVIYSDDASLLVDWTELTPDNRAGVVDTVKRENPSGLTNFDAALRLADDQVKAALAQNRAVSVIMLSDGQDNGGFKSVSKSAPAIVSNGVQVHTMMIGAMMSADTLEQIAKDTGGEFTRSLDDLSALNQSLTEVTRRAANAQEGSNIPDMLITPRLASRKTIIFNPGTLRIIILFLMGAFFKYYCLVCIGDNKGKQAGYVLHAIIVGLLAALWVEFGYVYGLGFLLVVCVYWVLMMAQIVRAD